MRERDIDRQTDRGERHRERQKGEGGRGTDRQTGRQTDRHRRGGGGGGGERQADLQKQGENDKEIIWE